MTLISEAPHNYGLQSIIIGVIYLIIGVFGFIINLLILYAIWKSKVLYSGDAIYILSTFSHVDSTLKMLLNIIFLFPATIFKQSFMSKTLMDIFSLISLGLCVQAALMQVIIAINRYILTINSKIAKVFKKKTCVIMIVVCALFAQISVFSSYYLMPCCRLTFLPKIFTFDYENWNKNVFNYTHIFLGYPFCLASTIIPIIFYVLIFFKIRKIKNDFGGAKLSYKPPPILVYAITFFFYLAFWVGFIISQVFWPLKPDFLNALIFICAMFDTISVSVVQACLNKKIRRHLPGFSYQQSQVFSFQTNNSTNPIK